MKFSIETNSNKIKKENVENLKENLDATENVLENGIVNDLLFSKKGYKYFTVFAICYTIVKVSKYVSLGLSNQSQIIVLNDKKI